MQRVSKFLIVLVSVIVIAALTLVIGAPALRPKKIVERNISEKLASLSELSYSPEHTWTIEVQSKLSAKDIELLDPETGESLNNQLNVHRLAARFGAFGNIKQRDGFKIITLKKGTGFDALWIRADGTVFGRNNSRSKKLKRLAQFDPNYYENPAALKTVHKLAASIGVKDNQIIIRRKSDKRDKIIAAYREKESWHGVLVNLVPDTLKIMPVEAPAQKNNNQVEPELRVLPLEVEPTPLPKEIEQTITEPISTVTTIPEVSTEVPSEPETTATSETEQANETETTLTEPENSNSETATPPQTQTDPNATATPAPELPSENLESEATTELTSETENTLNETDPTAQTESNSESETTSTAPETIVETETSPELPSDENVLGNDLAVEPEIEVQNQQFDVCGDLVCNGEETCNTCELDCGRCAPVCGDGNCLGETCVDCPLDCGECPPYCGDGKCHYETETCVNCSGDCGECPAYCGDKSCNGDETCETCPGDCGECPPSCGDGKCNGGETCETCPGDCQPCGPVCGDSKIEGEEQCDDGNTASGDGCVDCKYENKCGDGTLDDDENCDDGNTDSGDGCSADCEDEVCGDGTKINSEECDDGNTDNNDGCSSSCYEERCGDSVIQDNEQCDDGNTDTGDGCVDCEYEDKCGDGVLDDDENCDDGNKTDGDGCTAACEVEECGDDHKSINEECDDGNTNDGDGCSASCIIEFCGDGIVNNDGAANTNGAEECDLGSENDDYGQCRSDCRYGYCGDGFYQPQYEDCDPQAADSEDCPSDCELVICGDNNVEGDEECDDGNEDSGDGCSSECVVECGNGSVDSGEDCDDGNTASDDGCDASCMYECGNGTVNSGEECDDGNATSGDGCDNQCKKENCEISVSDVDVDEGEQINVNVNVKEGGKLSSISVESEPVAKDWTNLAQSTTIEWQYDVEGNRAFADKGYWYGYGDGETLCTYQSNIKEEDQGKYKLKTKVTFANGCTAEADSKLNIWIAQTEDSLTSTLDIKYEEYQIDYETNWDQSTELWKSCGSWKCNDGECIDADYEIVVQTAVSSQYHNIVSEEESFHYDQATGQGTWSGIGGLYKDGKYVFDDRLIEDYYNLTDEICATSAISDYAAEVNLINKANRMLDQKLDKFRSDYYSWKGQPSVRCWIEYTAKRDIQWTKDKAAFHFDCAYARTLGCPAEPTEPAFFWDNK